MGRVGLQRKQSDPAIPGARSISIAPNLFLPGESMAKRPAKFDPAKLSRSSAAAQLRHARERYGSVSEMARKTNIPRTTLAGYLKLRSLPSRAAAQRSAAAFNRIHFRPPLKPPRQKAYTRAELTKLTVWGSAANPNALTSKKLSRAKIDRAARAIAEGKRTPRIVGDRIETIRKRFENHLQSLNAGGPEQRDAASAASQNAGSDWFDQFKLSERGRAEFAQAWADEIKTQIDDLNIPIRDVSTGDGSGIDPQSERRAGQFDVFMPAGFAQVMQYLNDLGHRAAGYFSINVNVETGVVSIYQSVEQKPRASARARPKSKGGHRGGGD